MGYSKEDQEILQYMMDNGIIDLQGCREKIEMAKREEYLEKHPYKIWKGKDGLWNTYLPDEEKKRIPRRRKTKKEIEDVVTAYWKSQEENPTVKAVYEEWVHGKLNRNEIQRATKDRYDRQFKECFKTIKNRRIKNITDVELEDFILYTIANEQLTRKAYSNFRTLIYGIFRRAKKRKFISYSITELVSDIEISRKMFRKVLKEEEDLVFTETDTDKILTYFANTEMDIIDMGLLLLFKTGLRPGELAGLKSCDAGEGVLDVCRTEIRYLDDNGKTVFEVRDFPKTEAGIRHVIIPENARWLIKAIKRKNPFGEFLFEVNGERLLTYQFSQRLQTICKKLGIKKKSPNKIRKTYGTILLDNDVDESVIISQMGHTSILTTKKYYYRDRKNMEHKEKIISDALA